MFSRFRCYHSFDTPWSTPLMCVQKKKKTSRAAYTAGHSDATSESLHEIPVTHPRVPKKNQANGRSNTWVTHVPNLRHTTPSNRDMTPPDQAHVPLRLLPASRDSPFYHSYPSRYTFLPLPHLRYSPRPPGKPHRVCSWRSTVGRSTHGRQDSTPFTKCKESAETGKAAKKNTQQELDCENKRIPRRFSQASSKTSTQSLQTKWELAQNREDSLGRNCGSI